MRWPIPNPRRPGFIAVLAWLVLPLVGAVLGALVPQLDSELRDLLGGMRQQGLAGDLAVAAIQIAITASGLLPASLSGVVAGALYGPVLGFASAALCTLAGSLVTFVLTRSLASDRARNLLRSKPRLQAMDRKIASEGWRFVCLLRTSPVMPFAATSSALALSSVRLPAYLGGTLASLPALFGYVFTGAVLGGGMAASSSTLSLVGDALLASGVLATCALGVRLAALAVSTPEPTDDAPGSQTGLLS